MVNNFHDLINDREELIRVLSRLGIDCHESALIVTPLTGGISSNIARIEIGDKTLCLKQALPELKTEKSWQVPVDRVYAEIQWLQTANELIPTHVPRVLGVDKPTNSFIMEYLPDTFKNWKTELMAGRINANVSRELGEILGRLHAGTAGDDAIAKRFANDSLFHAIRLEPYLEEAARQHPSVTTALTALVDRTRSTRKALMHGDVSPKNIMIGPHGPVLLDAECACYGDPAFDLAFCLNHLLLKAAWQPMFCRDLLDCFDGIVESYLQQVAWEPLDDLQVRVQTLLPALLLARIDGKSPVEYLSKDARQKVRQLALNIVGTPAFSLSDITVLWQREFA